MDAMLPELAVVGIFVDEKSIPPVGFPPRSWVSPVLKPRESKMGFLRWRLKPKDGNGAFHRVCVCVVVSHCLGMPQNKGLFAYLIHVEPILVSTMITQLHP